MIALVTGGAASGKSAYAEALACSLSPVRTYVATMANDSVEAMERIEKHRAQRACAGFETIEVCGSLCCVAPAVEAMPAGSFPREAVPIQTAPKEAAFKEAKQNDTAGVILLDDIGNLVSNALFATDGTMADVDDVLVRLTEEFDDLTAQYAHVVVVGNEVGASGQRFDAATATWVRVVGSLCCAIAARSDTVVEVVAGCPNVLKGLEPMIPQATGLRCFQPQAVAIETEGSVA